MSLLKCQCEMECGLNRAEYMRSNKITPSLRMNMQTPFRKSVAEDLHAAAVVEHSAHGAFSELIAAEEFEFSSCHDSVLGHGRSRHSLGRFHHQAPKIATKAPTRSAVQKNCHSVLLTVKLCALPLNLQIPTLVSQFPLRPPKP